MSQMRSVGLAVVAAFVGAMACGPSTKEEPRSIEAPCRTYCDRWAECGHEVISAGFDDAEDCAQKCIADDSYQDDDACQDEWFAYRECTAKPEYACPKFKEIYTAPPYDGPCGPENKAVEDCLLEKN